MATRFGHLLYFVASWIAVIVIASGVVAWLYFARPNYDPLGLVIVVWGIIIWFGGRAIRYWLGGQPLDSIPGQVGDGSAADAA